MLQILQTTYRGDPDAGPRIITVTGEVFGKRISRSIAFRWDRDAKHIGPHESAVMDALYFDDFTEPYSIEGIANDSDGFDFFLEWKPRT